MSQKPPNPSPPQPSPSRQPATIAYARPGNDPASESVDATLPPPPPTAPRAVTPTARRRSLIEPNVRFWWLAALSLTAIGIWYLADQIIDYRNDENLIKNGTPVVATIEYSTDNDKRIGRKDPPGTPCGLRFQLNGQPQPVRIAGAVLTSGQYVVVGATVNLRVDPINPASWTDRTTPEALGPRLIVSVVIVPALLVTLILAWYLRQKVLQTWRNGVADAYGVHDIKRSALAPLSMQIRCWRADGADKRLLTVYVPNRLAKLKPGDLLWLIHPKAKTSPVLAALAFE